jgi:hypothetical protein
MRGNTRLAIAILNPTSSFPATDRRNPGAASECGTRDGVALARNVARVVPLRVLLADLSALTVDDQLAPLLLREVTPVLDRLVLGVVGRARVAVHLTRPSISVWHYVNIAHAARLPGNEACSQQEGR